MSASKFTFEEYLINLDNSAAAQKTDSTHSKPGMNLTESEFNPPLYQVTVEVQAAVIGLNRQDKCFWEGTPEPLRVQGSLGKR